MTHDFESAIGKLPPQNIEAEAAILGGIMLDPQAIARVKDSLRPEHFYLKAHSRLYDAMLKLHLKEMPPDLMVIVSYLADNDLLEIIGGRNKLVALINQTVGAVNIEALAELVMEKWQRRQLGELATLAHQMQYQSVEQLPMEQAILQLQQKLSELQQNQSSSKGLTHLAETLVGVYEDVEERSQGQKLPGTPCGFYDLDGMTGGFQRSDLIIVAGRPSMGKTAFCLNIANNIAAAYKLPVAIFSLEMSKQQLGQRLLASEAGIEQSYLRSGRISYTQWEPLSRAISTLSDFPIYLDETPNPSFEHIETQCRRITSQEEGKLGLVVVDYLQLMEGGEGFGNRNLEISILSRGLKCLARKLQTPVMCLSQLSRSVESRTNKRPTLSDLRDSGSIEQDADVVMMLYRDDYYNSDSPDRGVAEVIIAKHRNGPTGTIKLLFDSQLTKFKNLVKPEYI